MFVDYTLLTSQVFQMLMKYLLNRSKSFEILKHHKPATSNDLALPSWTPDWRYWSSHCIDPVLPRFSPEGDYSRYQQQYEDWDSLQVEGTIAGIFTATEDGGRECRIISTKVHLLKAHWPEKIVEPWPKVAYFASDILVGDILVMPNHPHNAEIVLRPRASGGYTFVRPISREAEEKSSWAYNILRDFDEQTRNEWTVYPDFVVW